MANTGFVKTRIRGDHHRFKDHQTELRLFKRRVIFSLLVILVSLSILVMRFFDLQVENFQSYSTQSDRNRLQVRPVAPNRGLFLDARGEAIAENRAVSTLTLTVERVGDIEATIEQLRAFVDISDEDIKRFNRALKWRRRPYQSVPLKYNLSEEELARIAVHEFAYDGVDVEGRLVRYYPNGSLFTHVAGYVGRINEKEQSGFSDAEQGQYAGTQTIGKIGLEKFYESVLLGEVGQETIETDARGRVLNVVESINPVAGKNIDLFLDIAVQLEAIDAMAGRRGSVVAIDIETGGVVAMLSSPSYDPNLFVTGISETDYGKLNYSRDLPLFNRSIQGQYPPGSTIKPIVGLAALENNVVTPETHLSDPGYYQLENDERLYRDWKPQGHGKHVDLHQAIVESCDTFFYDIGKRMGVDRLHAFGLFFGLGQRTSIDVPSERRGLWPSREWKKQARGLNWYPGNSLNMSIGQGDVLTTPLQLATMTATLANRGTFIEPRVAKLIGGVETEKVIRSVYPGVERNWDYVLKGMHDVIHSYKGTAQSIRKGMAFEMAGKTGTAQVVSIAQDGKYDSEALSERNRDHALFVGYAPYDNPKIAIAVVIENGEQSSKAGIVAKRVLSKYLEQYTLGE